MKASNTDDGSASPYDILNLPDVLGLKFPLLKKLNDRFYDSTILRFASGDVESLRDELGELLIAYRARRERELIEEHHVHAIDPSVRSDIVARLLDQDVTFRALGEFLLLCEEAIAAKADVRCEGD
jgi:hypothetical protein